MQDFKIHGFQFAGFSRPLRAGSPVISELHVILERKPFIKMTPGRKVESLLTEVIILSGILAVTVAALIMFG